LDCIGLVWVGDKDLERHVLAFIFQRKGEDMEMYLENMESFIVYHASVVKQELHA
jgi:hypothetical protein